MQSSRFRVLALWTLAAAFMFGACGGSSSSNKSSAKDISVFAFRASDNPGLAHDVIGTVNGTALAATLPFGSDLTALKATFATSGASVTVGSVAQVSGTTANDFSSPVQYTVTAEDGTTQVFTATVTVAANPAKAITAFGFLAADNSGLASDVTATISGANIAATVPFGTNVTALVASFTTTGASVSVGGTAQVSDTTANDFSSPVIYTVTADDGTTTTYTVTVTVAPSTSADLTSFAFLAADNPALASDVTATINGTAVAATVPYGTDVSALVATFTSTGQAVMVSGTPQVSGATADNFANPVTYTIVAADSTTKAYTVTVTVAPSPAKAITSFEFTSALNSGAGISTDVVATISGTTIAATVPYGTDVTGLVATFATTGASVDIGGATQTSGASANDFTSPVVYTVTAADGTAQDYTVTVTIAANPAKDLTSFELTSALNSGAGVSADAVGVISGQNIAVTVPYGTTVTGLIATFTTTGQSVAVGGTTQASGITANDFSSPVTYTVTAADGTTKDYLVTITVAPSPAKDITSFVFTSALNSGAGISSDVTATIDGTLISASVPFGSDVTALIATFSATGPSVVVAGAAQTSGMTANDFTNPVTYRVTAADGTTQDYTVVVTVAANPAKDITAFSFERANNPGLTSDRIGTISGTSIKVTVPAGTNVTALVATFTTSGQTVTVNGTAQVSGATANDFSSPVYYTVTAADHTTKTYQVTTVPVALLTNGVRTIHLDGSVGAAMPVAFDPVRGLYYASAGGFPGNATLVWNATGGGAIQSATIDIDMRAFLWNANTQQIEACPYNVKGGSYPYSVPALDGSGLITGGHTAILASMPGMADPQSSPAYDAGRDVLYSRAQTGGTVAITHRSDGSSAGTVTLDFAAAGVVNAMPWEVGYDPDGDWLMISDMVGGTGDIVRVFDAATGAYVGSVQLDLSDAYQYYNADFSNGQWWEYDGSGYQGFKITN